MLTYQTSCISLPSQLTFMATLELTLCVLCLLLLSFLPLSFLPPNPIGSSSVNSRVSSFHSVETHSHTNDPKLGSQRLCLRSCRSCTSCEVNGASRSVEHQHVFLCLSVDLSYVLFCFVLCFCFVIWRCCPRASQLFQRRH